MFALLFHCLGNTYHVLRSPITSCVLTPNMLTPLYVILDDALLHESSALQALQKSFPADTECPIKCVHQEMPSPSVMNGVTDFGSVEHTLFTEHTGFFVSISKTL